MLDRHGPPAVRILGRAVCCAGHVGIRRLAVAPPDHPWSGRIVAITNCPALEHLFPSDDQRHLHRRGATARLPLRDDLLHPLAVLRQREIGVRFALQLLPAPGKRGRRHGNDVAVLVTSWRIARPGDRIERGEEALLELPPLGTVHLDLERVAQEVLGPRVLVEPPDQVADGIDEIFLAAGRCIQQQVARELEQRAALCVRHALEHLELHLVERVAFVREHEPVGEVEQVVRGHAHVHGRQVLGLEDLVDHALVVRVGLELRLVWRLRPPAHRGLGSLTFHVGPFHEPDGDAPSVRWRPVVAPIPAVAAACGTSPGCSSAARCRP